MSSAWSIYSNSPVTYNINKYFKNKLIPQFYSMNLEKDYIISKKFPKWLIITFSSLVLAIQSFLLILIIVLFGQLKDHYSNENQKQISELLRLEIYLTGYYIIIILINFIVSMFWNKNQKTNEFFLFTNYLSINLILVNLCSFLSIIFEDHESKITARFIMNILSIILRFAYLLFFDSNFIRISVFSMFSILITWLNDFILGNKCTNYDKIMFSIANCLICFFSYFIDITYRKLFLLTLFCKKKENEIKNQIENFGVGHIVLNREEFIYINDFVKENLNLKVNQSQFFSDNNQKITNLSYQLIKSSINDCICIKSLCDKNEDDCRAFYLQNDFLTNFLEVNQKNEKKLINLLQNEKDYNNILDYFDELPKCNENNCTNKNNDEENSKDKIFFLGVKEFKKINGETNFFFEVYLKININYLKTKNPGNVYEIFLKDVSFKKKIENTKDQLKYITMFIAKVAHEFKNPLICICELLDGIHDNLIKFKEISKSSPLSLLESASIEKDINLTKNLSEYMMILVKDFEVISIVENSKILQPDLTVFDLEEEIRVIQQISKSLLIKTNKDCGLVKFRLKLHKNVPKLICTDKVRLKQVLINLLSNSIKFTQAGYIKLEISYNRKEGDEIPYFTFAVIDTGKGLNDDQLKFLFQAAKLCDRTNNPMGSGFGLNICKDICKALGSDIRFEHNKPKGCIFKFELLDQFNKGLEYSESQINLCDVSATLSPRDYNQRNQRLLNGVSNTVISKKSPRNSINSGSFDLSICNENGLESKREDRANYILNVKENSLEKISQLNILQSTSQIDSISKSESFFVIDKSRSGPFLSRIISTSTSLKHQRILNLAKEKNDKDDYFINNSNQNGKVDSTIKKNNEEDDEDQINNNEEEKNIKDSISKEGSKKKSRLNIPSLTIKLCNQTNLNLNSPIEFNIADAKSSFESRKTSLDEISTLKTEFSIRIKRFKDSSPRLQTSPPPKITILCVDDDHLVRKSTIRIIENFFKEQAADSFELNIIEACDGIECIFVVYEAMKREIHIDLIIMDETMNYISGSYCVEILNFLMISNKFDKIPIAIVSGYEESISKLKYKPEQILNVFTKPVDKKIIQRMMGLVGINSKKSFN